jgi:hypothetical protein
LWFSCEWFGKALAEHRADLAAGVLKTSFLPGRSFSGPADSNTQLAEWLERVNQRPRRALGCAPCDRIVAERQQMLTLPPVPPATGWRIWLRLPRDHVRDRSVLVFVHPRQTSELTHFDVTHVTFFKFPGHQSADPTARLHESALDRMGRRQSCRPWSVARSAASLGSALSRKASTCSTS